MHPTRLIRVFTLLCLALFGAARIVAAQTVDGTADQREQLIVPNPASNSLGFGASVAIAGDSLIIGAPYIANAGHQPGTASIYIRSGGTWVLQGTLVGTTGIAAGTGFGGTVDISGDTAIVGGQSSPPHARVYARNGGAWTLQGTLVPDDGVSGRASSVAIDGNTAVVGIGTGASYVFVRTGTTWTQQAKLTPAVAGSESWLRQRSVALDGDTALIGAPYATVGANARQGAMFVFVRSGNTWSQQGTLASAAGRAGSQSGTTVALSGDTALFADARRAYRFTRTGGVWTEQTPIVPPDAPGQIFPPTIASITLDSNTAILGGAGFYAYVFRRIGGQWSFQDRLVSGYANDPHSELFGLATAVSGSSAVVGAPDYGRGDETNGPGRAYVYALPNGPPAAPTLAGSASATTVSLSWTPAAGATPTSYIVEAGTAPGASNLFNGSVGNVTQVAGTVGLGTYFLRVRGVNAFGAGAASNEISLTVGAPAGPPPGPPANLMATVTGTTVSFTWNPPSTGGPVGGYLLVAGLTPGFSVPFATAPLGPTPGFVVPGVPPGTFHVRLLAQNTGGMGPASNEISFTVSAPPPPAAPVLQPPVVTGSTVQLAWSGPAGASFTLVARGAPTGPVLVSAPVGGVTTLTASGVGAGTYHVTALANVGGQTSAESNQVVVVVQ